MKKENYKVSVVVPTYNRAKLLLLAIKSIQNQTHQNIEIIIVDDCSTDQTEEYVGNIKDWRIIYIKHEKNLGGSAARNTGIKYATGTFIGFLDSDDQWLPDKLMKQLAVFEKNSQIGVVYTGVSMVNEDRVIREIVPHLKGGIFPSLIEFNCIDTTSSVLVKKELLEKIEGFDASLPSCQDWDLYLRLSQITKFDFVDESLVLFNQHLGERITTNNRAVIGGHFQIYNKYKESAQACGEKRNEKFRMNISKMILKAGIIDQDKNAIILSRNILTESISFPRFSLSAFIFYATTFLNLKSLLLLYKWTKKANYKYYSASKQISLSLSD